MSKKALMVVSFGTTYLDALGAIEALETALAQAYPDYDCHRAFTSGMVMEKLRRERGIEIFPPAQMLERLAEKGYQEVLCQPTHVLHGEEYDKLCAQIQEKAGLFSCVKVGAPLLSGEEDYRACCAPVLEQLPAPLGGREALVLMGHGSDHFANAAYSQLENMFRALGHERVYVGTVEGFPSLDYVFGRLRQHQVHTLYLMPFMMVAGDHAQNDLAGRGPDSWKSQCEGQGYEVKLIMRGLGQLPQIGQILIRHLQNAKRICLKKAQC